MPDNPGLGEQALNKAAEIGLSSQLDAVENLDVNIAATPLKVVQGEVDAVTIEGEGLVMKQDLRMETMEMQMSSVAINPLSITFGKIELTKSTAGSARVVLNEADINRAFNSEYVRAKLQNQQIHINEQVITIAPQKVDFHLLNEGKVTLHASVLLLENGEIHQIAFAAVPFVSDNGQIISLKNVEYSESEEISPELTKALVEQTSEILNLSNFDLSGMSLQIKQLEIVAGKLILQVAADIEQIQIPFS
ncbi:DUF2993 domain-containing protein [Nostocales cyanobacterium LEGE 11386]|nr:DUF2993 domain-containing protein [Nostocales cyanobacterium LEGE 11386]